jgi:hypothetical protein
VGKAAASAGPVRGYNRHPGGQALFLRSRATKSTRTWWWLVRVDKAGVYHLLSLGTIRPACRKIDIKRSTATEIAIDIDVPEPLTPGEPITLKFSLTPQPVLLRAEERLLRHR